MRDFFSKVFIGNSKDSGSEKTDAESWPIFICYRRSDGQEIADSLYQALHEHVFQFPSDEKGKEYRRVKFDVYLDKERGADPDYIENINHYITNAKAFVVVCTKELNKRRQASDDVVFHEIDFWLGSKKKNDQRSAPILFSNVDHEIEGQVPEAIKERWPRLNVLPIRAVKTTQSDGRILFEIDSITTRGFVIKSLVDSTVDHFKHTEKVKIRWRWFWISAVLTTLSLLFFLTYSVLEKNRENLISQTEELAKKAEISRRDGDYFGGLIAALDSWPLNVSDTERQNSTVRDLLSEELTRGKRIGTVNIPDNVSLPYAYVSIPPGERSTFQFSSQPNPFSEVHDIVEIATINQSETVRITPRATPESSVDINLGEIISQRISMLGDEYTEDLAGADGARSGFGILDDHQNLSGNIIGIDVGVKDKIDFRLLFRLDPSGNYTYIKEGIGRKFNFIQGSDLLALETQDELIFYDLMELNVVSRIPKPDPLKYMNGCEVGHLDSLSNTNLMYNGIKGLNLTSATDSNYVSAYWVGQRIAVLDISNETVVAIKCPFEGQAGVVFSPETKTFFGWGDEERRGMRVYYRGTERNYLSPAPRTRWHGGSANGWHWLQGASQAYSYAEIDDDGLLLAWPKGPTEGAQLEIYTTDQNPARFQAYSGGIETYLEASQPEFRYSGYLIEFTDPILLGMKDWNGGNGEDADFSNLMDYSRRFIQGGGGKVRSEPAVYDVDTGEFLYEAEAGYFIPQGILDSSQTLSVVPTFTGYTIRDVASGIELVHILLPNGEQPQSLTEKADMYFHLTSEKLFAILRDRTGQRDATEFAAVYQIELAELGNLELVERLCNRFKTYLDLSSDEDVQISARNKDSVLAECLRRVRL